MRVTIACSWRQYFHFWLPTLRVSTASFRRLGEKACVPSPRRRGATPITGSCTVGPRWAVVRSISNGVYERVQPRLPEVSRCKSALFRSPKGSQYQLVQVVSDTKLSQSCCSARDLLYIIRISRVTNSTNTDFSRDQQYKIRVFINCACVPGFSIDCCTLFKRRCMIIHCTTLSLRNISQTGRIGQEAIE